MGMNNPFEAINDVLYHCADLASDALDAVSVSDDLGNGLGLYISKESPPSPTRFQRPSNGPRAQGLIFEVRPLDPNCLARGARIPSDRVVREIRGED